MKLEKLSNLKNGKIIAAKRTPNEQKTELSIGIPIEILDLTMKIPNAKLRIEKLICKKFMKVIFDR